MKQIKELKRGDYFTTKEIAEPSERQVWVFDGWDRSERKYYAYKFADVNSGRYFKSAAVVFVDFTF